MKACLNKQNNSIGSVVKPATTNSTTAARRVSPCWLRHDVVPEDKTVTASAAGCKCTYRPTNKLAHSPCQTADGRTQTTAPHLPCPQPDEPNAPCPLTPVLPLFSHAHIGFSLHFINYMFVHFSSPHMRATCPAHPKTTLQVVMKFFVVSCLPHPVTSSTNRDTSRFYTIRQQTPRPTTPCPS
jgi:hypothetical protein